MQKQVDNFILQTPIHNRSCYHTYKGHHKIENYEVYVKVYPLKKDDNTENDQFYNEMCIMEDVKDKLIAYPVIFLQTTNNIYHIYKLKDNLKTLMQKKRLKEEEAIDILQKCLQALQLLHNKDIVHKNLTPKSFLVEGTEIQITKLLYANHSNELNNTQSEMQLNKDDENYLAPEILKNESKFDKSTNIYSIGTIFYEMLFGILPYSDTQLRNYNTRQSTTLYIPDLENASMFTQKLLKNMLNFVPSQRSTVDELLLEIQEHLSNSGMDKSQNDFIIQHFQFFMQKIEFLNQFGSALLQKCEQFDTAIFYHYLITKKIYLTIVAFKKHFDFEVEGIRALEELQEEIFGIKSIVRALEKESLSQLLNSQRVIQKNYKSNSLKFFDEELNSIEDQKNFSKHQDTIVKQLLDYNNKTFKDAQIERLNEIYVQNESNEIFEKCRCRLIMIDVIQLNKIQFQKIN